MKPMVNMVPIPHGCNLTEEAGVDNEHFNTNDDFDMNNYTDSDEVNETRTVYGVVPSDSDEKLGRINNNEEHVLVLTVFLLSFVMSFCAVLIVIGIYNFEKSRMRQVS